MTLGAPSLSSQYYFADGETGAGIAEQYAIYNPTDTDVTVDAVFLGLPASPDFLNDTQIAVPAGRVVILDTADVENLSTGRHAPCSPPSPATRSSSNVLMSRPAGNSVATSVVMGSPPNRVHPLVGVVRLRHRGRRRVVVLNVDSVDTTVTVSALVPGGLVRIPALESLPLPAGGIVTVLISDPSLLGRAFVVSSGQRIFVERSLPRGHDLDGRSGSFLLAG